MKPPRFDYTAPTSLDEAIGVLVEHADADPRVLAGGQSLVPLMNFRLAHPGLLVDLRRIPELVGIRLEPDALVIGAMTRQSAVEDAPEVALAAPLLAEAVTHVAHRPVRNSGTIGGSLAHADPAAELPAVALALDADLVATGPGGTRTIPASDFFTGPLTTALEADEILTEIRIPRRDGGHAFVEFARTHGSFAVVAVAALVETDGGRISRASVALTGVAPTAVRAAETERLLTGATPDAGTLAAAADAAVDGRTPGGDLHASAQTRITLARTHVRRALDLALTRAQDRR